MGWQTRAYLLAMRGAGLWGPAVLRRRLARGKEHPERWVEKLGITTAKRPAGPLVWVHAVGLGEVLAMRGIIAAMHAERPDLSFLVTSSTRTSAEVFARNLPPRTQHQFLPLDAPKFVERFLDHWHPDLAIWAEQDLWPGAVRLASLRGIPQVMINARMNAASLARRRRVGGLYRDALVKMRIILAQDPESAANLRALGDVDARVGPSLKAGAARLSCDQDALAELQDGLRVKLMVLASSHVEDEVLTARAAAAQGYVLVIVPRDVSRGEEVRKSMTRAGLRAALSSAGGRFGSADVFIDDAYGTLGLWYRLADVALMGGSFGPTQGHNPWEAAALGCAVLHGPEIANFTRDYKRLGDAGAALEVTQDTLKAQLGALSQDMGAKGLALSEVGQDAIVPLAQRLVALTKEPQ